MELTVLGTGGMMPMPHRPLSSVAIRTGGAAYLLDCGEGTQVPYKALHVGLRRLRLLAVTHLHADHCLGVPGMLMLRSQMEAPPPLTIVGPAGIARFVDHVIRDLACTITFPIRFAELDPDRVVTKRDPLPVAYEDDLVTLRWAPLRHTVFCAGLRLEEQPRPGKFLAAQARRLGIEPGPAYGKLQAGEAITAPDGGVVTPAQVMGPPRRGAHLSFCTDTAPCPNLYRLMADVDVAFLEGMFLPEHQGEATRKAHLSVADAARIATRAKARRTLLTHLSPRYDDQLAEEIDALLTDADGDIRRARDGERFEVRPEG